MIKIDIDIPKDMGIEITPRQLEAARVNAAEVVMETVRENFLRRGGRRYWLEAADAVTIKHGGKDTLVVNIAHRGVALHYYGGTVRPTKSKLLALPAAPDMTEYARSVPGLMLVPIKGRPHLRGLLVKSESGEAKRKWKNKPAGRGIQRPVIGADGKLEVKYTLVDETHHRADPSVLPPDEELALTPGSDPKMLRMLYDLVLKAQAQQIDARKLSLLEAKARQADEAKAALERKVANGGLTPEALALAEEALKLL